MRRLTKCVMAHTHEPYVRDEVRISIFDTLQKATIRLVNCRWCGIGGGFKWSLSEQRVIEINPIY